MIPAVIAEPRVRPRRLPSTLRCRFAFSRVQVRCEKPHPSGHQLPTPRNLRGIRGTERSADGLFRSSPDPKLSGCRQDRLVAEDPLRQAAPAAASAKRLPPRSRCPLSQPRPHWRRPHCRSRSRCRRDFVHRSSVCGGDRLTQRHRGTRPEICGLKTARRRRASRGNSRTPQS